MAQMQAYTAEPGADQPVLGLHPFPQPQADELLIRVRAAAINNGDLSSVTAPHVPGFEFAGDVVAVGDGVDPAFEGSRVAGIGVGAFAEYVIAHRLHVLPVPDGIDFPAAATLPTALTTEYGAARRAGLREGDAVLITAAGSGIGLLGLQIARALGARTLVGTTRSPERREFLERAGADHVIVTQVDDLAEAARKFTDGIGVDVVLDHVGGETLDAAIQATRIGGNVVSVGRLAGRTAEIDLFGLARRQVRLQSVSYGLEPPSRLGDLFEPVIAELLPQVADGRIVPVVDRAFAFNELPAALDRLRAGRPEGKVVLLGAGHP